MRCRWHWPQSSVCARLLKNGVLVVNLSELVTVGGFFHHRVTAHAGYAARSRADSPSNMFEIPADGTSDRLRSDCSADSPESLRNVIMPPVAFADKQSA